jgi:hypothetical protein
MRAERVLDLVLELLRQTENGVPVPDVPPPGSEVTDAEWRAALDGVHRLRLQADRTAIPLRGSLRVQSDLERLSLSPEAFGLLLRLRAAGLVDEQAGEQLLNDLLQNEESFVGVEEMREAVVALLLEPTPGPAGSDSSRVH